MKIIADLHVHTVSSGHAYSTLEEYLSQAKEIGLKAIAIADHGPRMPGGPHLYHFCNMKMIPRKMKGIRIYRAVEANIINENGEIDLTGEDIEYGQLDFVMATFHPRVGYEDQGEAKNTAVLLKTIQNPYVKIIAHPGNPKFPVNPPVVVAAAKKAGVAIEINSSSPTSRVGSYEKCLQFAQEIKKQEWKVVIGSDAHISTMLGDFREALQLVKKAGLQEKHIINTSMKKLEQFLAEKKDNYASQKNNSLS